MDRAYSLLTVKEVSDDRRVITGVATTPTPDRVGDIVEPMGVEFRNPMPLLHHHAKDQPVGLVSFTNATKDGINFTARLPKIEVDGPLKDRVDTAWQEIKAGLVRGVSIGFRPLETSMMDDGGLHFLKTEVLELSLVTVPANADAVIDTIKSFDAEALAASGNEDKASITQAASRHRPNPPTPRKVKMDKEKTTAEKITAFEAKREAKSARMVEIMKEAGDETLGPDEKDEYDTAGDEIKAIDEHLVRLNALAKVEFSKAKPVVANTPQEAVASRDPALRISVREAPGLPPGVAFARVAKCLALAQGNRGIALEICKMRYPDHTAIQNVLKTAVAAGTVSVDAWAGALVGDESSVFADFVEFLRPLTVIGQFGTNGVPSLRRVPFRTRLVSQTTGGTGYWVGEGQAKPVTKFDFASTTLLPYKAAGIAVLTMEVIRDSNPSAEAIVRDQLAEAVRARLDTDFLDPQKGLVADVSPASISNGLSGNQSLTSSGRDADSVRADIVSVFSNWIAANNMPSSGVWVMSAITALNLSLMTNALGQPEFPGVGMTGGRLQGLPIITSEYLGYTTDSPTEGRDVFLVNAGDIYLGDDGGMSVDMSTEASLQMQDDPTNASGPTAAPTTLVSMFQTNSVAFRAERTISWKRRRTEAVVQLAQVEWGEASGVNP